MGSIYRNQWCRLSGSWKTSGDPLSMVEQQQDTGLLSDHWTSHPVMQSEPSSRSVKESHLAPCVSNGDVSGSHSWGLGQRSSSQSGALLFSSAISLSLCPSRCLKPYLSPLCNSTLLQEEQNEKRIAGFLRFFAVKPALTLGIDAIWFCVIYIDISGSATNRDFQVGQKKKWKTFYFTENDFFYFWYWP